VSTKNKWTLQEKTHPIKSRGKLRTLTHQAGDHKAEIKARKPVSNQTIEGAFSLFKRGLVGSYHQLSEEHLDAYLGEFCWRYNRRGVQSWMFDMALESLATSKPMPYKELTKF
jgi:hypothetical protein